MTENLPVPADDAGEQRRHGRIELVASPDDPDDVTEVTIYPDDVSPERLTTAWISADAEDLVDLEQMR